MTIGPEPTRQIVSMSVLRGKLVHPLLEQRPRIVWAGTGFWMELQRTSAQLREREALDRSVVERDVRRLFGVRGTHGEAVVLARDEHTLVCALQHRMVRAAMAERELERLVPGGHREHLVAEADAEDARAAEQVAHRLHLGLERAGIAGARREEHTVVAGEVVRARVVRMHRHGG